ncbi:MAG: hypothetical protein WA052_00320 [Microgenomates group bacterium]
MEILIKDIPSGTELEGDLLLSLLFAVQNVTGEGNVVVKTIDADEDGATVSAVATGLGNVLTEYNQRRLALSILWFLWCHGLTKGIYVEIQNGTDSNHYEVGDFPEISSLFFPSRK